MCTKDNDNFPPFQSAINLYIMLFEPAPPLIYVRSVCTTYQKGGGGGAVYDNLRLFTT